MTRQQEIIAQMDGMRRRGQHTPVAGWQNQLAGMVAQKQQNPITAPVAPGTPTQRRVEATQEQERWQKGFDADERHRAAQLSLQRRAAAGGGAAAATEPTMSQIIQGAVLATEELLATPIKTQLPDGRMVTQNRNRQEVVNEISSRLNQMGLEERDFNEALKAIRRAAGVPEPTTSLTPAEILENREAEERLRFMDNHGYEALLRLLEGEWAPGAEEQSIR